MGRALDLDAVPYAQEPAPRPRSAAGVPEGTGAFAISAALVVVATLGIRACSVTPAPAPTAAHAAAPADAGMGVWLKSVNEDGPARYDNLQSAVDAARAGDTVMTHVTFEKNMVVHGGADPVVR